jgi:predicted enzyme related to lactoylglutathione lyase
MGRAVVHWEIGARDAAAMQRFYADLFDWQVNADNPMGYGLVITGAREKGGIDGGIMKAPEGAQPYMALYVEVDDLEGYVAKAGGMGAQTLMPPTPIEGVGRIAMIQDPEGHMIGLLEAGASMDGLAE